MSQRERAAATSRRDFLKAGVTGVHSRNGCREDLRCSRRAAAGSRGLPSADGFSVPPIDPVRIGFVGVGLQGGSHVRNFLRIDGVEIKAIYDIDEARAEGVGSWVSRPPAGELPEFIRGGWSSHNPIGVVA